MVDSLDKERCDLACLLSKVTLVLIFETLGTEHASKNAECADSCIKVVLVIDCILQMVPDLQEALVELPLTE